MPTIEQDVSRAYGLAAEGKPQEAEAACRKLIRREPGFALPHVLLGHLLRLRGDLTAARDALETARRLDPSIAQAHAELGLVLAESGDTARVGALARRALEIAPRDAHMHWITGQIAVLMGRGDAAEKAFATAEKYAPGIGEHRYALGVDALRAGRFGVALVHLTAAARRTPEHPGAWTNLGISLYRLGRVKESAHAFARARRLQPQDATIAALLADALLRDGGDPEAAVAAYRAAETLDPTSDAVAVGYASALSHTLRYEEAKTVANGVVARDPDNLLMRWLAFQQPLRMSFDSEREEDEYLAQWRDGIAQFMERLDTRGLAARWAEDVLDSTTCFYLAYRDATLVDEHRANAQALRRLALALGLDAHERAPAPIERARRRVGIVSPHLYNHSVHKVFGPMVFELPRDAFELHVFNPSPRPDAVTEEWRARADAFVDGELTLAAWAERIASSDLDVLVYLDIGMHPLMNALTALRLAPVQVALWGHPITTGSDAVDYFVSARDVEPPGADAHYVERLVLLPNLGTRFATPQVTASPFHDRETVELACVQSAAKVQPRHDALWARILAECPNARLTVFCGVPPHVADGVRDRLTRALVAAGVDPSRLTVTPMLPPDRFDTALRDVDVLLDTLGFSGGITGFECLARELPIVALPGTCMRSRQTAAMLQHIGVDDLVARDADDYVAIAVRLCREPQWRRAVVERIAATKSRLFDDAEVGPAFARFLSEVQPP